MSEVSATWSLDTTVYVEYHFFYMFDFRSSGHPGEHAIPGHDSWSVELAGGVAFASAATSHDPTVGIRLFDREPLPDKGQWEKTEEGQFDIKSTEMILACPTASPDDTKVPLGRSGNFHYRMHYRNPEGLTEIDIAEGNDGSSEEYVIQIW